MDGDGNALALWSQNDGDNYRIDYSRFDEGTGTWSAAAVLDDDDTSGHNAYSPAVAITSNGDAVAAWIQNDGTRNNVHAKKYTATTETWGSIMNLESSTYDVQYSATYPSDYTLRLCADGSGNFIVLWAQYDASFNTRTNANVFDGAAWGTASEISTTAGTDTYPRIACDGSDNAVAVWTSNSTDLKSRYFDGTSWGTVSSLESSGGQIKNADVVFCPNGDYAAVWTQYDGAYYRVNVNRRPAGGSWAASGTIIDGEANRNKYQPRIESDLNSNVIAVWSQSNGVVIDAYACRMSGGAWGTPVLLDELNGTVEYSTGNSGNPDLAFFDNGNAMAVWYQHDGYAYSIFYSLYSR